MSSLAEQIKAHKSGLLDAKISMNARNRVSNLFIMHTDLSDPLLSVWKGDAAPPGLQDGHAAWYFL